MECSGVRKRRTCECARTLSGSILCAALRLSLSLTFWDRISVRLVLQYHLQSRYAIMMPSAEPSGTRKLHARCHDGIPPIEPSYGAIRILHHLKVTALLLDRPCFQPHLRLQRRKAHQQIMTGVLVLAWQVPGAASGQFEDLHRACGDQIASARGAWPGGVARSQLVRTFQINKLWGRVRINTLTPALKENASKVSASTPTTASPRVSVLVRTDLNSATPTKV
eukprot:1326289-Rhodomonas_salina.1